MAFLTNIRILKNCPKVAKLSPVQGQSGPCDPVSHFCLPQFSRSKWNLSNSVNQVYDLSPLFYFITPVHQISVLMFNLKVERESKNNHSEKDKLHISGLVFRQSLKAPENMSPPSALCCCFMQHTAGVWFACSWHSMEVMSSPKCGFKECQWDDSAFQVLILTFIPSMYYILLECLLTTPWGNSFPFG